MSSIRKFISNCFIDSERDRLFPEDELFRTLVVENESKLMEAQKKLAKKQGII